MPRENGTRVPHDILTPANPANDRTPNQQQQSALFTNLCPELRCLIWRYALSVVPAHPDESVSIRRYRNQDRCTVLSLLAVCRKIHEEAAGIFYHDHCLRIASPYIRPFVRHTSLARRENIRTLKIGVYDFQAVTAACRHLRYMSNIKDVLFSAGFFVWDSPLPWPDEYTKEDLLRESGVLKTCCLHLVASAQIRLDFKRGTHPTKKQETYVRRFEEAIHKAQRGRRGQMNACEDQN